MNRFALFIVISLLIVACSSKTTKVTQKPQRKLTRSERLRQEALERYRLLRLDAIKNPKKYKRHYKRVKPRSYRPKKSEKEYG